METGKKQMDEADQAIEMSEKAMEDTINTGAETSKESTEELSTMNKLSKLVKKIPAHRCLMFFDCLSVVAVVAILAFKLVYPSSEDVQGPGSTPPT